MIIALHAHHEAELPIEVLNGSYAERLHTIEILKSLEENDWKIVLRKKLFVELTPDQYPDWLRKADAELDKARAELDKARAEWLKADAEWSKARAKLDKASAELDKASAEWRKAWQLHKQEIIELHDSLCKCGWTEEDNNIFEYAKGLI